MTRGVLGAKKAGGAETPRRLKPAPQDFGGFRAILQVAVFLDPLIFRASQADFAAAFEVRNSVGNGAFETGLGEADAVAGEGGLYGVQASQFPLVDGDLLDQGFFHFVLGFPGGHETG
ncbi:MAG TPA: hypothetical protein VMR62_20590 [Bryobacteraceae bacterium]|nr:hypothetical protein [Bryobacteraceae bacterium]